MLSCLKTFERRPSFPVSVRDSVARHISKNWFERQCVSTTTLTTYRMDLFNLMQPSDRNPFFMPAAAMNQMSRAMNLMNGLMRNPWGAADPFGGGLMGMDPHSLLGSSLVLPGLDQSFPFPPVDSSFQRMSMLSGDPSVHSFSSSTMMSMSTGPDGRPVVYQASSSTRSGPGGVRETQKSVCDSITGTKKMQIGRHIGERGHVVEKEHNLLSGDKEEREDFINIDEEEAEHFEEEFQCKSRMYGSHGSNSHRPLAITSGHPRTLPSTSLRNYESTPSPYVAEDYSGAEGYSNHYGATESPSRNPSRLRRGHGRSSEDYLSSRRSRTGQIRRSKGQSWSRRK